MDYATRHHLWQPMAAISPKGHKQPSLITISPFLLTTPSSSAPSSFSAPTTPPPPISPPPSATSVIQSVTSYLTESNDIVWHTILFSENSNNFTDKSDIFVFPSVGSVGKMLDFNTTFGTIANNLTFDDLNRTNRSDAAGAVDETIQLMAMVVTAILLGFVILATVIGNVFVIAAILLERNLQNVANYLILSLAVADLLVACLVMPLGAVYEVSKEWTLGPELCDMWTSSDVLCCTASILHLVAIALDRYWAVTNIDYIHQRTAKRIGIMIFIIWTVSFLVCIAPLLGWKDPSWADRIKDKKCLVSQDLYYQIFATASSFYLPLLVILILYWRIFQTARKRIRRRQVMSGANTPATKNLAAGGIAGGLAAAGGTGGIAAAVVTVIGRPLPTISETTTAFTNVSSNNSSPEKTSFANGLEADLPTTTDCSVTYQPQHYPVKRKSRDGVDSKRERKAAKTLAIITGAFVLCWLPFFIMAVLLPIDDSLFDKYLISVLLWLGYFNSTLNPIIYTIFSPEFRHAFKKILCGRNYARRRHFGVKHFQ